MPAEGPGVRQSLIATKATEHGAPVVEKKHPGIAAKSAQVEPMAATAANALLADNIGIGEEFVVMLGGVHEIPSALLPGGAVEGDGLWIREADNLLRSEAQIAEVQRSLVTGVVGNNNAILWTAQDSDGPVPRITLVDPGGANAALAVDVDGRDIIVSLATSAGSAITSTAAQVIAAVLEHDVASQLVSAANSGASSGAGVVVAVAATALAGGGAAGVGHVKFGRISEIDTTLARAKVNLNLRDTL